MELHSGTMHMLVDRATVEDAIVTMSGDRVVIDLPGLVDVVIEGDPLVVCDLLARIAGEMGVENRKLRRIIDEAIAEPHPVATVDQAVEAAMEPPPKSPALRVTYDAAACRARSVLETLTAQGWRLVPPVTEAVAS